MSPRGAAAPRAVHSWPLVVLVMALGGCRDGAPAKAAETLGEVRAPAIYGTDNRKDVAELYGSPLYARARESTVALMHASDLKVSYSNYITFKAQTLGVTYNLCGGERFLTELVPAFCSGTLIDDELVLTAGHCITTAAECASTRFVFRFYRNSYYSLESVTTADVFNCQELVVQARGVVDGKNLDYAIVRLDRPATPSFTPAPLRAGTRPMATGQQVAVIGASSGMPFKIDSSGTVLEPRASTLDYFVAATDTFHGSSGSGVYELNGYGLAGILVRGGKDYAPSSSGSCRVARVCGELGCRGEDITYVRPALEAYCQAASNPRLCPPAEASTPINSHDFIASNTQMAQRNTVNRKVTLAAGEVLYVGTCGMGPGSSASGDTYLRVFGPAGTEVASNDDACGGRASWLAFTAQAAGEHELRVGCHGDERCSGTLVWSGKPLVGTWAYSAVNTDYATRNTVNWDVDLLERQSLTFGTCDVEGASGSDDNYLRLHGPTGVELQPNRGSCGSGMSKLTYAVPVGASGRYQVRAGCGSSRSCSGTVAWNIQ